MSDVEKKRMLSALSFAFYLKYSDFSIDNLRSSLSELYQSNNPLDFFEISFLEILIEIRSCSNKE